MVEMSLLLKKVTTLGVRMHNPEDLTRRLHPFVLGQNTVAKRKKASMAADRYSKFFRGGAAPSLADANILAAPDLVYLPATFLQNMGQLTRTRVIYV